MASNNQCECKEKNHDHHKVGECENVAMEGQRLCVRCNDLTALAIATAASQHISQPVTFRSLSEAVRSTTTESQGVPMPLLGQ